MEIPFNLAETVVKRVALLKNDSLGVKPAVQPIEAGLG